jgi:hypothetical protein
MTIADRISRPPVTRTGVPPSQADLEKKSKVITNVKNSITFYEETLRTIDGVLASPEQIDGKNYYRYGGQILTKKQLNDIKKGIVSRLASQRVRLTELQTGTSAAPSSGGGGTGSGGGNRSNKGDAPTFPKQIVYNCSAVKEAYFPPNQTFFNKAGPHFESLGGENKFDKYIYAGNTPVQVADANDLWNKATAEGAGKGMIQTWNPPGGVAKYITDGTAKSLGLKGKIRRNGFQFIYNPTTIAMGYGGVVDIDPGFVASGRDPVLPQGGEAFQSTIGIQVIINRMYDLKYIAPGGKMKNGQISDHYSGRLPTSNDLKRIYNRGTMYDIEYLLKTMFPYQDFTSQLRGKTSDIGYLGAMPVEFHLGNKLRYVGQINGINVNHVIFDYRMVPIFTTITISANRMPDYQGGYQN